MDNQVKIRGFRIEPGEIEALLNQHQSVKISVVTTKENTPGNKYLVAYVVFKPDTEVETSSLRTFLQERVPGYMIPQAFVSLSALPLNPNGKVDLFALPTPEQAANSRDKQIVAPRNLTEEKLVGIFAEVLEVETVDIYDDFFDLGGHSLIATKLIARLLSEFQIDINVIDLFEASTVEGLAQRIENKLTLKEISSVDTSEEEEREEIRI